MGTASGPKHAAPALKTAVTAHLETETTRVGAVVIVRRQHGLTAAAAIPPVFGLGRLGWRCTGIAHGDPFLGDADASALGEQTESDVLEDDCHNLAAGKFGVAALTGSGYPSSRHRTLRALRISDPFGPLASYIRNGPWRGHRNSPSWPAPQIAVAPRRHYKQCGRAYALGSINSAAAASGALIARAEAASSRALPLSAAVEPAGSEHQRL